MEERRRIAALDEVVRRDPVRQGVDATGRRAHAARDKRSGPRAVIDRRAIARADAPFGPPQREVGPPESGDDRTEVERRETVRVRGDEVERQAVCPAVLEQVVDPARGRGRRAADPKARVDRLDEPNLCVFWSGAESDYLRLYDASV